MIFNLCQKKKFSHFLLFPQFISEDIIYNVFSSFFFDLIY